MLAEGTSTRDWQRISRDAEARGCSIETAAGYSAQVVAFDGLSLDWEQILEWAVELTYDATFPEERCDWVRQQAVAELESLSDLPEVVTGWAFLEQLYPRHPLGRPLLGTVEGLSSLGARECADYHRDCLARGPLISVAGMIDPEAVLSRLARLKGEASTAPARESDVQPPGSIGESRRRVSLPPGDQAHLCIGGRTVKRADPDYEALRLLGVVLGSGSGLVGRIPERIREDEGLAYGCEVDTVAGAGLDDGRLIISLGTSSADADQAVAIVREELELVRAEGISRDELESARSYLLGREPFRRETARQQALLELEAMFWELPLERLEWVRRQVQSVTHEAVNRVAHTFLDPSRLIETVGVPQ
jgi:zinc protease